MVSSSFGYGTVYRAVYGENSDDLITQTNQLIDDAVAAMHSEQYNHYRTHIYRYLEDMKNALGRLIRTYNYDADTKGKLGVCQTRIISNLSVMTPEDKRQVQILRDQSAFSGDSPASKRYPSTPWIDVPTPQNKEKDPDDDDSTSKNLMGTSAPP
jgi:hypothetical protein